MPSQTIKVAFRGQLRSFSLPIGETATPTWSAFESRIRAVHSIPADAEVSVSYLDADGDRISIDTDGELADLLRLQTATQTGGPLKSLRFELSVSDVSQASAGASDGGAFVLVGDGTTAADPTPVEAVPRSSSVTPEAQATATTGDEATSSTPEASTKGKNPEAGESDGASGAGPSSSAGPSHPFQTFFENVRPHLAELKEEFEKSNMGPTIEKIAKEAQESLEPALKEAFESARQRPDFGPFAFGPGFHRGCGGGRFSHPWANWRNSQAGSDGWSFGRRGQAGPLADPAERVWVGVVCDGCGESSFHGARYRCQDCRDFDLCQACRDGDAGAAHARFGPPGRPHDRLRHMRLPDDAAEDDAIAALREMGFPDNGVVRDLVRRYGGSVERVVELLAREQTQQFDAPTPSTKA